MRRLFATLLLADEAFKAACLLAGGNYRASYLRLHLCSINIFIIALHALRPCSLLDNFLYAICIPAALAALLFPTWVSLPAANFMHLHSFTVHILLAGYPIMLTAGGDIRPQARYLPGCVALVLALPVYFVNVAFGTNFMFLMQADAGSPLLWFQQAFGGHLVGLLCTGRCCFRCNVRPAVLLQTPARPLNMLKSPRPGFVPGRGLRSA